MIDQICATARAENREAAAQLVAIGELFGYRFSRYADNEEWAIDTVVAVAAEVGAALRISQGQGPIRVHLARALRERLPMVGAVFAAGEIDYRAFQTIVSRTDLVLDPDVLAAVDAALALEVPCWPSLSHGRLGAEVDKVVGRLDADAVRRRSERTRDREIWIGTNKDGLSEINGSLCTPAAHALDTRLTALAGTVCEHDPRTRDQRRADALGALAAGADRLGCRCGRDDCAAGKRPSAGPVTIHVIAEQATIDGTGCALGCEVGADGLITAEMVAELAKSAKLMPLQHPGDSAPDPGHVPSRMLASFVRCRDLTCRWPGLRHTGGGLRCRPYDSQLPGPAHPCRQPQVLLPAASSAQDLLGLAGAAIARRHADPHLPRRTYVCHDSRQRLALPQPVPFCRWTGRARSRVATGGLRRTHRDDAEAPPHPRPSPSAADRHRTPSQPRRPLQRRRARPAQRRRRFGALLATFWR